MLSRPRCASLLAAVLVSSIWASACEKVPLLAPSGSTLTLTASATALPLGGSTQLIAQIVEPAGTPPHSGTAVSFTTTLGSIEPAESSTDSAGRVVVTFKAGTNNGTASISAISGGVSASGNNAVKIALGTAAVGRVIVSANPTLLPSLGGSSTISATVLDINGNALSSAPVNFSTTGGTVSPLVVTTDANGIAVSTLQTSTLAVVTASVGAQGTTPTTPTTGNPGAPGTSPPTTTAGQASGSVTVSPKPQPAVSIVATTTNPTAGTDMVFTASVAPATNAGTVMAAVAIDFGDLSKTDLGAVTGAAIALHHVYSDSKTYTVVLSATDSNGGVGTATTTVFVQPATPLGVTLAVTKTIVDASNTLGTFTATVTGLGNSVVLNYHWVFGDGQVGDSTTNTFVHPYTHPAVPPTLTAQVFITTSAASNNTANGSVAITP